MEQRTHKPLVGTWVSDNICPICDKEFDLEDPYAEIIVKFHKNSEDEWVEVWNHRDCVRHMVELVAKGTLATLYI